MAEREMTRVVLDGPGRRLNAAVEPPPVLRAATALPRAHPLLLRIGLLNSLFLLSLVVARLAFHGQVHPVVYVAVGLVLAVYAVGTAQAVQLARLLSTAEAGAERVWNEKLSDLDRLAARCPKVAMAGTVTGFLIAFSASTDDVAERVRGASTGLSATLVGIAAMLLLELQHDWLAHCRATH